MQRISSVSWRLRRRWAALRAPRQRLSSLRSLAASRSALRPGSPGCTRASRRARARSSPPQWVLTAGHCLSGAGNKTGFVAVDGSDYTIAKTYVDPAYSGQSNDAGLIKITGSMPGPFLGLSGATCRSPAIRWHRRDDRRLDDRLADAEGAQRVLRATRSARTWDRLAGPRRCGLDSAEQSTVCQATGRSVRRRDGVTRSR